jgi:pimeloyl-ACP methyl ester carboxylesterase
MTTYVLVHGSTLGGWSWAPMRQELERHGHRVLAPSLTGLADRAHLGGPDTGLVVHIEDITRLLRWEDLHDVVLVGSSYGGMVITGVAGEVPERLRHLVYLDAFRPQPGQCSFDQLPDLPAQLGDPLPDQPWAWPVFADYGPFGVTDPEQVAWLSRYATPMPTLTHREPLPQPKHPVTTPGSYVQGAAAPIFDDVAAQARRDGLTVHIWPESGHLMYVTEAKRTAELLLEIGR